MEFYDILNTKNYPNKLNKIDNKYLLKETLNRILWSGWKVDSLRSIHPWKFIVLQNDFLYDFWEYVDVESKKYFQNMPESEFFTKYYHPNFSYEFFKKNALSTIVIGIDKESYKNELKQLSIFKENSYSELLNYDIGKMTQNIENAIYNEDFCSYTLHLESHIEHLSNKIKKFLDFPENTSLSNIISIFYKGDNKNINQRPLDTFIYEGSWKKNSGNIQECEKATSCKRFRFIFPKNCPICKRSVSKLNHFHDVAQGLIYCEEDFFKILTTNKEYNDYDISKLNSKKIPRLCEHSIDCENYYLYLPKLCVRCNKSMDSHFHDIFKEVKYCYSCTHILYRQGNL